MKKQIIIILLLLSALVHQSALAQTTKKYFDSNWLETPREKAFYYSDVVQEGKIFHFTSYWAQSGKLYGSSTWADSNFVKGIGARTIYYESGILHDSIVYDEKGQVKTVDEFSENGKPSVHAYYDPKVDEMVGQLFDESGNKKPGFITYQKKAMFPGGQQGWIEYLQTHLKANVPNRNKAPVGIYTVNVVFLIGKDGKISEVTAKNNPGYGTAEEAVRVIAKGPNWIPAIQNNKQVIYRQIQPISFQVEEAKK